jgi:hypothetical protein
MIGARNVARLLPEAKSATGPEATRLRFSKDRLSGFLSRSMRTRFRGKRRAIMDHLGWTPASVKRGWIASEKIFRLLSQPDFRPVRQ